MTASARPYAIAKARGVLGLEPQSEAPKTPKRTETVGVARSGTEIGLYSREWAFQEFTMTDPVMYGCGSQWYS